jgi:hypothetical protein
MPSTYTSNSGIEKPGSGEQSGTWGTTVNTNMDIIDRSVNGVKSIALSGSSSTLTTSDGLLSDGHHALLRFTGTLAGTHTVTISPSDAQKIYFVRNSTDQTVTFSQGSGSSTADVASGKSGIVYADGSDECHNLTDLLAIPTAVQTELDTLEVQTNKVSSFTGDGADLNYAKDLRATGVTTAEFDKLDGLTATTAELNIMDGVTASTAELNKMDGVTASTAELNKMDGVTATTAELNILDGVTATATEINLLDGGKSSGWAIRANGTTLEFKYNGNVRFKMTSTGTFQADDDIQAVAF